VLRPKATRPLTCCYVVVELRGFEPLTPCMPSMCGGFTTPCRTSRPHTTAQVRGAVEGWVMGRREATRSAVSGKSLARTPAWPSMARAWAPSFLSLDRKRLAPPGALLSSDECRVERRASGEASSVMTRAYAGDASVLVARGLHGSGAA
jgi:hypothetical protein